MHTVLLMICLALAISCIVDAQNPLKFNRNEVPVVEIPYDKYLDELPDADLLLPGVSPTIDLELTATPALIVVRPNNLNFSAGVYANNVNGQAGWNAPTLRLKPGDEFTIRLTNNLTYGIPINDTNALYNETNHAQFDGTLHDPLGTNIHTHGLHTDPGARNQAAPAVYTGGDNIFIDIQAATPSEISDFQNGNKSALPSNLYTYKVNKAHLPGLHWIHPHRHSSTFLQSTSMVGHIIVEDDNPRWLPDSAGCGPIRQVLEEAPEVLLSMRLLPFESMLAVIDPAKLPPGRSIEKEVFSNPSYQEVSDWSTPENPYCCGHNDTNPDENRQVTGTKAEANTLVVNGGLKPRIRMVSGEYQRWRLLFSGPKKWFNLIITEDVNGKRIRTPDCEMLLIAKDGVYLPEIPRAVDLFVMASGNRVEGLVRCSKPGIYSLAAADEDTIDSNATEVQVITNYHLQDEVATLEVADSSKERQQQPPLEKCIPLRPSYAADLRDAAIDAAGAQNSMVYQNTTFTFDPAMGWGCTVNFKNFTYPDPEPVELQLGKVTEWTRFGALAFHPVHLHTTVMMIQDLPTEVLQNSTSYTNFYRVGDFQDTVLLPMQRPGPQSFAKFRMQPGPYAGYAVMHCHFLSHEDAGCMKVVQFQCPGYEGGETTQPDECQFQYAVKGTVDEGAVSSAFLPGTPLLMATALFSLFVF